ncbi:hypothetical protein IMG5_098580 [Ichthyophthirius multifiliis]|uniref:Uncharacterized protein n=1 Tax=Ichthyophthirius multifiliis TaxID=5932 RepID=G0QRZ2_ICHMU|nr:hypothetical protein IMG5_098580 [Ichthyophthirius multifiliis]EGR32022.1 hypothetical protein IMG5_098580 [Ichthyophthirius multifiliis]|eukprot:XP_004035508.1 hypothetical protein IMG5_098580 [Ichthyophthirius multifiliis]
MQAIQSETYDFSAKPKLIQPHQKYRENLNDNDQFQNLMFEKRVVRGNTYARVVSSRDDEIMNTKQQTSIQKKQQVQIIKTQKDQKQNYFEPGTPKALAGRQNFGVQTDEYIETLTDKPPEYEKDTQTEVFIDRPNARLFFPQKDGIDRETQIWEGDLFDFDQEVETILQVLIKKILENSRMEVLEEEELKTMKEQQKQFEQIRNVELAEVQRLEAKEKRIQDENERRKIQYDKKKEINILSHKKLVARNISKNHLYYLKNNTINMLEDQGVFRKPLEMALYDQFEPWLYQNIIKELIRVEKIENQLEVGLIGGLIGEYLLFLQALTQSSVQEVVIQASEILLNSEKFIENFKILLQSIEGSIDFPLNIQVEDILAQRELNLNNIFTANQQKQQELIPILQSNVQSVILNIIQANENIFGLQESTIEQINQYLINGIFKEEALQQKIKFCFVKSQENIKQVALLKIKPNLENLQLNPLSSRIEEKQEEQSIIPINLADSVLENKASVFVQKEEDLEVFVQHCVAEQFIRQQILKICLTNVEGREQFLLFESVEIMENLQKMALNILWENLPQFDIGTY